MYYSYTLYSIKDGKLYHGFTEDVDKRFINHQSGRVASTVYRRPLVLIHYEAFVSREDALEKEQYYKTGPGRKYIKRHLQRSLKEIQNKYKPQQSLAG